MEAIEAGRRADQRPLVQGSVFHRARELLDCTEPAFIQSKWLFHCEAVMPGRGFVKGFLHRVYGSGTNASTVSPLWLTDVLISEL